MKKRPKWEKSDANLIFSQIPGTIVKIFVEEGQKVRMNQKLFTIEYMKMVNTVKTQSRGIIKKIYISEGETVPSKLLLIEIE